MKSLLLNLSILVFLFSSKAQSNMLSVYPEIGERCPDFVLRNIKYFSSKEASLNDFTGKWLVLDFWNKHCGACVASFPRTSELQKRYQDRIQFMLVGIQDQEGQIERMYDKFRSREHLIMPCAFDSSLANRFDIQAGPFLIIIDPNGIVRAITNSVDSSDIRGFINGNPPHLRRIFRMHEDDEINKPSFDPTRPFLLGGNGGADSSFLFRSLLARFDNYTQQGFKPSEITDDSAHGRFQVVGVPAFLLYNYAYYGVADPPDQEYKYKPILEVRDSSLLLTNSKHFTKYFSYSLTLPLALANKVKMESVMRRDLENYFGFSASIERRDFFCWRLVATEDARKLLKTKGGPFKFNSIPKADFDATNCPFNYLLEYLKLYLGPDLIDDTGMHDNIDIKVHCLLTDTDALKSELAKCGLVLVPTKKAYKVLVIKDSL